MARPAGCSSDEEFSDDGLSFGDSPITKRRRPVLNDLISDSNENIAENDYDKFITAILEENVEEVRRVIKAGEIDINPKHDEVSHWTPLLYACSLGSFELVSMLLKNGANVKVHFELQSPVILVCDCMRKDEAELIKCLETLVEHEADISSIDWFGATALHYAVRRGRQKLVLKLISLGSKLNKFDNFGWTPMFYAVDAGNVEMVQILKDAGSKINAYDVRGRTMYEIAVMNDFKEISALVSLYEKPPDLDEVINRKSEELVSHYKYILSELPDRNKGRFSGFPTDALKMINGIGLDHLLKIFIEKDIQLGELLTMDDKQWEEVGVSMSYDRTLLMNSVHRFHERHWGKTSLSPSFVDEEVTLFMAAQVLSNIARQMHVLSTSIYYWNTHSKMYYSEKDIEKYIVKGLSHVEILCREIDLLLKLVKEIDKEQNIVPADLIKPHTETRGKLASCSIFICVISSLVICGYSSVKLLPPLVKQFVNR